MTRQPHTAAQISRTELDELRALIEHRSAVHLDESRERFLSARALEFAEELKLRNGTELIERIRASALQYEAFLERMLTQETSFFRYPAVFDALRNRIVPEIQERKFWQNPRKLRVWSAGCSTGEEAYSIAMTICSALKFPEAWELEVLATDISRKALRHADKGVYAKRAVEQLPADQVSAYFDSVKQGCQVKPRIRRMVSFAQMNLAAPQYVGKMDVIFCMNVLMYFTAERRLAIQRGFFEALEPGGYFLLGHSETLTHTPLKFEPVKLDDCRLYRKPPAVEFAKATALAEAAR